MIVILVGALFIVFEAFSPGAFMVIPGTILIIIGIIGYIYPDFLLSWHAPVTSLALAVPATLITIKAYQLIARPAPPTTTVSESLVGREGRVTEQVEPDTLKGKVRIDSEIWSATSDGTIEKGAAVRVKSAQGIHVVLERIEDIEEER